MTGRSPRWLWPFVIIVYVLLLAPLVVVIAVSFGSTSTFDFPPKGLSLRWYRAFFASEMFVRSFFRVSQTVGLLTALVATAAGTLSAIGLVRLRFRGRQAIETFFLSPLLVPHILLGAAVYLYLARLAWATSSATLLVGHIVIATPYVIRCVTAGLVGMDPRLEEAAMSLGASRLQAFFKVTLSPPLPEPETRLAFLQRYADASGQRLARLREQDGAWWEQDVAFFDTRHRRAWIMVRRVAHTAHHRGEQTTLLRLMGRTVHSIYGPSVDTGGLPINDAVTINAYSDIASLLEGESLGGRKAPLPGPGAHPSTERPGR